MKQSNNLGENLFGFQLLTGLLRNLKIFYLACGYLWNKRGKMVFFLMKLNLTRLIESSW